MYSCTAAPLCENFNLGVGAWTNNGWTVGFGSTSSGNTGPSDDITGGGSYMYYETSGVPQSPVTISSECFDISALAAPALIFNYHMYGATMGTLNVYVNTDSVWSMSGDQGNQWNIAQVDLSAYVGTNVTILFEGIYGTSFTGDMAIDEVCLGEASVFGCMDANACNYDPDATTDDGSCDLVSCVGCTDPTATNYDATATIDDGSCLYCNLTASVVVTDETGACDGAVDLTVSGTNCVSNTDLFVSVAGGNGSGGNAFNLINTSGADLYIDGFSQGPASGNTSAVVDLEVFCCYADYNTGVPVWTSVATASGVQLTTSATTGYIQIPGGVTIPSG